MKYQIIIDHVSVDSSNHDAVDKFIIYASSKAGAIKRALNEISFPDSEYAGLIVTAYEIK